MSRNTKIVLGILGGLVIIGICICVAGAFALRGAGNFLKNSVVTDPNAAATLAAGVAEFDVPSGYTQVGMNFGGLYKAIILTSNNSDRPMIMFAQAQAFQNADAQSFEQQMRQALQQQFNRGGITWKDAGTTQVTIRGQQVTLNIAEGTDQNNNSIRYETGIFDGNSGKVLLMLMGTTQGWDQSMIDTFLASIR